MPQYPVQDNSVVRPNQFVNPPALQQNLHGGQMQPSQTVASASLQPNKGNQVQSSHPVALAFLRLALPDPFASCYGFSQPYNYCQSSQMHLILN